LIKTFLPEHFAIFPFGFSHTISEKAYTVSIFNGSHFNIVKSFGNLFLNTLFPQRALTDKKLPALPGALMAFLPHHKICETGKVLRLMNRPSIFLHPSRVS